MKLRIANTAVGLLIIGILGCSLASFPVYGALLYKSYVVKQDRGADILCDPYIVKKNDWLLKLFKQRGEISQRDFPEFLRIFERLNPNIPDINTLRPGQDVLIPLKKLSNDALPGQSTGIVTLPFVTISDVPDILRTYSETHTVERGDYISRLISRSYGRYGTKAYREGVKLFKILNPDVTDLNRIYPGQKLRLPDRRLKAQPWYGSLFDSSGNLNIDLMLKGLERTDTIASGTFDPKKKEEKKPKNPIAKAANILNATLLKSGRYYFPRKREKDLELDLSRSPVIHLKGGLRILVSRGETFKQADVNLIKSYWKDLEIVTVAPDASEQNIFDAVFSAVGKDPEKNRLSFSDNGVEVEVRARWIFTKPSRSRDKKSRICIMPIGGRDESTPDAISHYLKQHGIVIKDISLTGNEPDSRIKKANPKKASEMVVHLANSNHRRFMKELVSALGYKFAPNISITFPYSGIQIKAVSNLISLKDGNVLLVDFGDFFGDAVRAIRDVGLDIIQIKPEDSYQDVARNLLKAVDRTYSTDPTFLAAKRSVFNNVSLTIPGFLLKDSGQSKVLLSAVRLNDNIIHFLNDRKIKILLFGS